MSFNFFKTSQGVYCMDYEGDVASLTMWFLKILLSGTSSDCIMGRLSVLWDSTFISIKVLVMKLFKHMGYP